MKGIFALFLVSLFSLSEYSYSSDRLTPVKLSLYQPDKVLSQAVPSVEAFANYSKAIEEAFIEESNSITTNKNSVLSLVVIFNSQGKAKIWVTSESTDLILLFKNSAESALKKTPICKVLTGATGFASTFIVNNGTLKAKDNLPPIPTEWTEFIKRNNLGEIEASNLFEKLLISNP